MDVVIDHINARHRAGELNFTAQYATLAEYFAALNASRSRPARWARRERHDLVPYALDVGTAPLGGATAERAGAVGAAGVPAGSAARPRPRLGSRQQPPVQQNWWTGEFTSWPLMKKMTRAGAAVLRAAEQLRTTALLRASGGGKQRDQDVNDDVALDALRRASAEAQHHDAVDGTSPARVTAMWERHLSLAEHATRALQERAMGIITNVTAGAASGASAVKPARGGAHGAADARWTLDAGELSDAIFAGGRAQVGVYNPLAWAATRVVSLPVSANRHDSALCELVLLASSLPPLGIRTFEVWAAVPGTAARCGGAGSAVVAATITRQDLASAAAAAHGAMGTSDHRGSNATFSVSNAALELVFSKTNGELQEMRSSPPRGGADAEVPLRLRLRQQLVVYPSAHGDVPIHSDNYIFQPAAVAAPVSVLRDRHGRPASGDHTAPPLVTVTDGPVMAEVRVPHGAWLEQRFRVFRNRGKDSRQTQPGANSPKGVKPEPVPKAEPLDVERAVEHIVTAGPLPQNAELASRIDALGDGLARDGAYWSDESGWLAVARRWNDTKQLDPLANIAANYVPNYAVAFARTNSSAAAAALASTAQLTLMTTHSRGVVGGAVIHNASLEAMLHRRVSGGFPGLDDNSTVSCSRKSRLARQ
eukprot:g6929.t1